MSLCCSALRSSEIFLVKCRPGARLRVRQHAHARLVGAWVDMPEQIRTFYVRLPATRDVLFDQWMRSAGSPREQAAWVEAAQGLFPAQKAEIERQRAVLVAETQRRAAEQTAEAARQQQARASASRSAAPNRRTAPPAARPASRAAPGYRVDPFVAGMSASMAATQRYQQQQLAILSGARGPGAVG